MGFDNSITPNGSRGWNNRFGNFSERNEVIEKKRLPIIKPIEFMGGKWFPVADPPMYHLGDKRYIAEGPGVIKFEKVDDDGTTLAFAPVKPLAKTPIDSNYIVEIKANSKSLMVEPIVWRINKESIIDYEKRQRTIGIKIGSCSNKMKCNRKNEKSLDLKSLGKIVNELNSYYKLKGSQNGDYSDDESDIGALVGNDQQKPSEMLNVAVKYINGHIQWFSWPEFIVYDKNEDLTSDQRSQIGRAIKMLEKSEPETWEILNVFNK